MKSSEINSSLIGKKVNGYFLERNVTGTIVAIVKQYAKNHPARVRDGYPAEYLCTVGVRIKLDKSIQWAGFDWDEYEATASVETGRGNLKEVSLI